MNCIGTSYSLIYCSNYLDNSVMLFDNTLVNVAPKKWNNIGGSISPLVYSFMQNKFSNIILIGVTDSIYLYNNF